MGTAASFGVHISDINDAERVAGHDTALVQREAVLQLSFRLVHEALGDGVAFTDEAVGLVLYFDLFLLRQTPVVSDIQVSFLCGLLGTGLPYVGS